MTDEQGGGEPLVILPLDEYEALIDGALGLDEEAEYSPWGDVGESQEEIASIQIPDGDGLFDSVAAPEEEENQSDEVDVDEDALKALWAQQETPKDIKKTQEPEKKAVRKQGDGEEQFYLEPLD